MLVLLLVPVIISSFSFQSGKSNTAAVCANGCTDGCGHMMKGSTQDREEQEQNSERTVDHPSTSVRTIRGSRSEQKKKMDPSNASEKSGKAEYPPAYHADMGYPPAQGVAPAPGGYPPAPGYSAAPYGAQPYPGQAPITVQPTVYVTQATFPPVPDYLGYSIFTMLCCCLPLGIAALIYSINVSRNTCLPASAYHQNHYSSQHKNLVFNTFNIFPQYRFV